MPWAKAWGAVDSKGRFKYPFPPTVFYEMAVRPVQRGAHQCSLKATGT